MQNEGDNKLIRLTPNRGKRVAQAYEIQVPNPSLGVLEDNAEKLVETLALCGGDIDEFTRQFLADNFNDKQRILVKVLLCLNKPGNEEYKREWMNLIAAFREAKIMVAENKAYRFIAEYDADKTAKGGKRVVSPSQFVSIANLWMKEHTTAQATRGKRKGAQEDVNNEQADLNGILGDMKENEEDVG